MSGIAGIFQRDLSPIQEDHLRRQSEVLAHRGPDEPGIWWNGHVGLVNRGFRDISQTSFESQPLLRMNQGLAISADARIDNREELFSRLCLNGKFALDQISDSELILASYEKWGENCTEKLLGDFSFVIYDLNKHEIFCGRDHFGVKPFYYFINNRLFVFGSEIKAILAIKEIPVCLNEIKIADFMMEMFEDKARTFYQDISRLPPAHFMIVRQESVRLKRYWSLDPSRELRMKSDRDYAEAYRELFVEAVKCRLPGKIPVGSMLSGGLDSSSVACVAGKLLEQASGCTLHTFSAIFDSVPKSDERTYMQAVLSEGNYQPHFIHGDQLNPLSDVLGILECDDEPFYAPQLFLNVGIWASAKRTGIRVLLDGLMGDAVVSHGYSYLNQLAREWKWFSLHQNLRSLHSHHEDPAPMWNVISAYLMEDGIKSWVPPIVKRTWRILHRRPSSDPEITVPDFLNPEFSQRIGLKNRIQERQSLINRIQTARMHHYDDLEYGLIPTGMEVYNFEISQYGLEARFPFLDRRLAEFCLAIPPEQKISHGYTRWVARQGLASYLPKIIRLRSSKGDLAWNFVNRLKADQNLFDKLFSSSDAFVEQFLNINVIRQLSQRLINGRASDDDVMIVFQSAVLIAWLKKSARRLM